MPGVTQKNIELGDVYYFSINAKSFPLTQPVRVKKGDVIRIRFYGAGGESHAIHPHGHDRLITHKDGYALPKPYYAAAGDAGTLFAVARAAAEKDTGIRASQRSGIIGAT